MGGYAWTEEERQFLRDNFKTMTVKEMAEHLGRPFKGVAHVYNKMKLEQQREKPRPIKGGDEFGQLVVKSVGKAKFGKKWYGTAECQCSCDLKEMRTVLQKNLRNGSVYCCRSCSMKRLGEATIKNHTKHGMCGTPIYRVWASMKERCSNSKCEKFKYYGGKGITVCAEWRNSFEVFYEWAISSGYSEGLTIERKDNSGNYEPDNCTWATHNQQKLNMTSNVNLTAFGETKPVSEWARDKRCPVVASTIYQRIRSGWDHENAITIPTERKKPPQK